MQFYGILWIISAFWYPWAMESRVLTAMRLRKSPQICPLTRDFIEFGDLTWRPRGRVKCLPGEEFLCLKTEKIGPKQPQNRLGPMYFKLLGIYFWAYFLWVCCLFPQTHRHEHRRPWYVSFSSWCTPVCFLWLWLYFIAHHEFTQTC